MDMIESEPQVIIVEDEPVLRDNLIIGLTARGFRVRGVADGASLDNGEAMALVGEIPAAGSTTSNNLLAPFQSCSKRLLKQTPNGMRDIGSLTIYTDRSVALKRVRYSFFIILIGSLIKTAGLWTIYESRQRCPC